MSIKKIISFICVLAIVLSFANVIACADEQQSGTILKVNDDVSKHYFNDLIIFEEGKAYLPMRLVFPVTNDTVNHKAMELQWHASDDMVRIIYGGTTGEDYILKEDELGKYYETPFNGERSCVEISLQGNPEYGATAEVIFIKYIVESGTNKPIAYELGYELEDKVYIKSVGNGQRLFISIDDVKQISDWLGLDDTYAVTLK